MTCCSLIFAILARNQLIEKVIGIIAVAIPGSVALLVIMVLACSRTWNWIFKLAASFAAAQAIGFVCDQYANTAVRFDFVPFYLVQAIFIYVWLVLGPILPSGEQPRVDAA
jgi:hypothetical protein